MVTPPYPLALFPWTVLTLEECSTGLTCAADLDSSQRPAACHLASQGLISRLEVLEPVLERHSGVSWKKKIKEMRERKQPPACVRPLPPGAAVLPRALVPSPDASFRVQPATASQSSPCGSHTAGQLVLFQQGPRTDSVSSFSSVPRPGQTSIAQCLNHESLLCMDIALSFQVMGSEQPRDYGGGYEIIYHNQRTKDYARKRHESLW